MPLFPGELSPELQRCFYPVKCGSGRDCLSVAASHQHLPTPAGVAQAAMWLPGIEVALSGETWRTLGCGHRELHSTAWKQSLLYLNLSLGDTGQQPQAASPVWVPHAAPQNLEHASMCMCKLLDLRMACLY